MRYIALLSIFLFCFTNSQTHRFFYDFKYKANPSSSSYENPIMLLDINPKDVKYYDYSMWQKDSTNLVHNHQNINWSDTTPISRKRNSTKNTNFVMFGDGFYAYETDDKINWHLVNETKKYNQYTLQKATTNFGGREWTAWFTKDIPINEGPYKFSGLPGLIVTLEDSEQNFIFELLRSQNLEKTYDTSNILEVRYGNKPLKTTEIIVTKKALEYYNDPLNDIRTQLKDNANMQFTYNGTAYKAEELSKLVKEEQAYILEYYNPIEKDKAIPFGK